MLEKPMACMAKRMLYSEKWAPAKLECFFHFQSIQYFCKKKSRQKYLSFAFSQSDHNIHTQCSQEFKRTRINKSLNEKQVFLKDILHFAICTTEQSSIPNMCNIKHMEENTE